VLHVVQPQELHEHADKNLHVVAVNVAWELETGGKTQVLDHGENGKHHVLLWYKTDDAGKLACRGHVRPTELQSATRTLDLAR